MILEGRGAGVTVGERKVPDLMAALEDSLATAKAMLRDRSAGRWCDICQAYGDHHTDRHPDEGGSDG